MSNTATRGASATSTKTTTTDEMTVVHTFAMNNPAEVRTYLQRYKGELLAHVRIFSTGRNNTMNPTRKGIAVSLNDVPKLAEAVTALVEAVKEQES
jgi:hypothetical protein